MQNVFFERIRGVCAAHPPKILFAEAGQDAVIRAARVLQDKGWAQPELIGGPYEIRDMAGAINLPTRGLRISNPGNGAMRESLLRDIRFKLAYKDMSRQRLETMLGDPLFQSLLRVRQGAADMVFSGNLTGIGNALRCYLKHGIIRQDFLRASAAYFLFSPVDERVFAFADCSVNVTPGAEQMADMARHTARRFTLISGQEARIAFLSFSTKGSASHKNAQKAARAAAILQKSAPNLICDGEIQLDAAIDLTVAQKKAPKSRLNGKANVFIFPSLNAANIAEKIVRHLAGFRSVGPVFQGFTDALHYIPGHASSAEIIDLVLLAAYFKMKEA